MSSEREELVARIAELRKLVDPVGPGDSDLVQLLDETERLLLAPSTPVPRVPGPLRIYVAGASKEPERCRAAMQAVQRLGFEITLDWLTTIELEGAANEGLDDEKRRRYALADLEAVSRADVVWVLAPTPPATSAGAWCELTWAMAQKKFERSPKLIIVSGPGRQKCIFASLASVEYDTDVEALTALAGELGAFDRRASE